MSAAENLPDGWKLVQVGSLCQLQRGFDITEATRVPGGVPVYSSSGVAYYHNTAAVLPPVVVTGRKGLLGRVFLVEEPCWPHDTTLWADKFNGNEPRFVARALANFHLERLDAATSVPTLNRNNLWAHEVAIPSSRVEQARIASVLEDADSVIHALQRLIAKKRDVKLGITQELLTGRRRISGFSDAWATRKLSTLGKFLRGRGIKRDDVRPSGVPCIRYGELYTTYLDYTESTVSFVEPEVAATSLPIRAGDILFAGSGETKEEIGTSIAYIGDKPAVAGGDIIVLRGTEYDPVYMASVLNTPKVAHQKARGGQGDAVVHINWRVLAEIELTVPPLPEQQAIAEVLRDADVEIAALEQRLDSARDVKAGMVQELLSGRTRLTVEAVA